MQILALGLSHHTAPLELRESAFLDTPALEAFLRESKKSRPRDGVVGLSTCNRTEVYVVSRELEAARADVLARLSEATRMDWRGNERHVFTAVDADAVEHLFRVASSIDSQVVGETQILAQVKQAYQLALDAGAAHGLLHLLFERALHVGKRARTETKIGEGAISVATVAVSFIRKIFHDLSQRRLLLVGAGEMGELAAGALLEAGGPLLTVMNRTPERAEALARRLGGQTAPFESLEEELARTDIAVFATGAPEPILLRPGLERAMARRGGRLLAALDIAARRNVDPACDGLEQFFLYDLAALEGVCNENRAQRAAEMRKVEAIVHEEAGRFMAHVSSLTADAVVRALRRRVEEIRQREIERYGHQFHDHEWERLDRFSKSLLNKALHDLTVNFKNIDLDSRDGLMEFDALCRALNLSLEDDQGTAED